jgi:hypothetical protein
MLTLGVELRRRGRVDRDEIRFAMNCVAVAGEPQQKPGIRIGALRDEEVTENVVLTEKVVFLESDLEPLG